MKLCLYRILMKLSKPFVGIILARRRAKGLETKISSRRKERFGYSSVKRPSGKIVWFNAASLGESNSIMPVVENILKNYKDVTVLVTTTTVSGAENMAKKLEGKRAIHQFLPVDRRSYVDRFFEFWKPSLGFFVDSDFWPNLILSAKSHNIPLVLLNGRISDRSFKKWKNNLDFSNVLMGAFEFGFGKSEEDRKRLEIMGLENTVNVGNLKYAVAPLPYKEDELNALNKKFQKRRVWVASSTHEGEEALCIAAHLIIKKRIPEAIMIIAPRHPARGEEIVDLVKANGLVPALRSKGEYITDKTDVYIADTMGELGLFYTLSNISFVGGSLIPWGGHNPMEPARLHNVVLSGKHVHNFTETFDLLEDEKSVIMVKDEVDLADKIKMFFQHPEVAKEYMGRAFYVAEREAGVLERVMDELKPYLKKFILLSN